MPPGHPGWVGSAPQPPRRVGGWSVARGDELGPPDVSAQARPARKVDFALLPVTESEYRPQRVAQSPEASMLHPTSLPLRRLSLAGATANEVAAGAGHSLR